MIDVPDLTKLSHAEKDALILALLRQLAAAEARIAAPEARLAALTGSAKNPDNSSKPPSQGQKPDCPPADRARRKSRPVPYTNNISERHLRPSVIFRKVTNGFRCEWGAETYAAFRSVVSTAKANRASVLDTIRFVLAAKLLAGLIVRVG